MGVSGSLSQRLVAAVSAVSLALSFTLSAPAVAFANPLIALSPEIIYGIYWLLVGTTGAACIADNYAAEAELNGYAGMSAEGQSAIDHVVQSFQENAPGAFNAYADAVNSSISANKSETERSMVAAESLGNTAITQAQNWFADTFKPTQEMPVVPDSVTQVEGSFDSSSGVVSAGDSSYQLTGQALTQFRYFMNTAGYHSYFFLDYAGTPAICFPPQITCPHLSSFYGSGNSISATVYDGAGCSLIAYIYSLSDGSCLDTVNWKEGTYVKSGGLKIFTATLSPSSGTVDIGLNVGQPTVVRPEGGAAIADVPTSIGDWISDILNGYADDVIAPGLAGVLEGGNNIALPLDLTTPIPEVYTDIVLDGSSITDGWTTTLEGVQGIGVQVGTLTGVLQGLLTNLDLSIAQLVDLPLTILQEITGALDVGLDLPNLPEDPMDNDPDADPGDGTLGGLNASFEELLKYTPFAVLIAVKDYWILNYSQSGSGDQLTSSDLHYSYTLANPLGDDIQIEGGLGTMDPEGLFQRVARGFVNMGFLVAMAWLIVKYSRFLHDILG